MHTIDMQALEKRLRAAPWKTRTALHEQEAAGLGISVSTLYRGLGESRGKKLKDAPKKAQFPDYLRDAVARVMAYSRSIELKNSSNKLATARAMRIVAASGYPEIMDWSESAVNAALRRVDYRLPAPRIRYEAAYACQQMQADFSRSKRWQIVGPERDGHGRLTGDWIVEASAKELHYKSGDVKLRTWVVQLVDEHSRLRLTRYYAATAESGLLLLRFLRWAWGRPEDEHLLRDLPERLKLDQGSAGKRKEVRYLMEKLGVDLRFAGVENSASQGKVERGFRTLWQIENEISTTELIKQGAGARITLSELNRGIHARMVEQQNKKHPMREGARGALYLRSIQEHPPRRAPENILEVAARTWRRKADESCMISIRATKFEVPVYARDQWVLVHRNAENDFIGELTSGFRRGEPFAVRPYRIRDLEDFENRPERGFREEVEAEVQREIKAAPKAGAPKALRPAAQAAEVASPFTEAKEAATPRGLTLQEARYEIGLALTREGYDPGHVDFDNQLYEGIPRADVQALVERIILHDTNNEGRRKAI